MEDTGDVLHNQQAIQEAIAGLLRRVYQHVQDAARGQTTLFVTRRVLHWDVEDPRLVDGRTVWSRATGRYVDEQSSNLFEALTDMESLGWEERHRLEALVPNARVGMFHPLAQYLTYAGSRIFAGGADYPSPPSEAIAQFAFERAKGEPPNFVVVAELEGLAILPSHAQLDLPDVKIGLRQPTIDDLPSTHSVPSVDAEGAPPLPVLPALFADLSFQAENESRAQLLVAKLINVLRLATLSSVECTHYRVGLAAPVDFPLMGSSPGEVGRPWLRSSLSDAALKQMAPLLATLWGRIQEDESLGPNPLPDPLGIALGRLNDALVHDRTIEARFASAIMGLESLYLPDTTDELSFRLRTRVGKAMEFLGHDALRVAVELKDAYGIRSSYAHGKRAKSTLSAEVRACHPGLDSLLRAVLGYLRESIVVFLIDKLPADDMATMLDAALLSLSGTASISARLARTRALLSPTPPPAPGET